MNNLNELNAVLFDTLRGVNNGTIDNEKLTSICKVSQTIINKGKLQISAAKLLNDNSLHNDFFGKLEATEAVEIAAPKIRAEKIKSAMNGEGLYERKLEYALSLGHGTLAKAYEVVGRANFENGFKEFDK